MMWIRGLPLLTHFSMTWEILLSSNVSLNRAAFEPEFISCCHQGAPTLLSSSLLDEADVDDCVNSCSWLSEQRAERNPMSACKFRCSAASSNSLEFSKVRTKWTTDLVKSPVYVLRQSADDKACVLLVQHAVRVDIGFAFIQEVRNISSVVCCARAGCQKSINILTIHNLG